MLDPIITLVPTSPSSYSFSPTEVSIPEQIKQWPDDIPLLPLPLWVEPQKGSIEVDNEKWEFFFHGSQGLSFTNIRTEQDVSIEYSAKGDIGITKWTTQIFLESLNSKEPNFRKLISRHSKLFDELTELGYLIEIPSRDLFVEEVFVFIPNLGKDAVPKPLG
jgi:hypothetical protein